MTQQVFEISKTYSRDEIYEALSVPTEKRRGNWETGYNRWGDDLFIFCNVGASGRSGHDYDNRWLDDDRFQWFAKERTHLRQKQIQWMLNPTGNILLFTRADNRQPFTFEGYCEPIEHEDTSPVRIVWRVTPIPETTEPEEDNDYAIENRRVEIRRRVKQSVFRQRVLENFGSRCCISGVSETNLLVASHIVPWSQRIESRLDPANGLCLYVLYDALFDAGYFTLSYDLKIIVAESDGFSPELQSTLRAIDGRTIREPETVSIKHEYLAFHREQIFRH